MSPSSFQDPRALPALYRLTSLAGRTEGDPRAALNDVLQELISIFAADAGSIALFNPNSGQLETEVQAGAATETARYQLKLGHGVTGWCLLNGRALLVPDVTNEPRYIAARAAARCEMAAPMRTGDQITGVIDLESDRVDGFTEADLALFERLTAEIANVVQQLWRTHALHVKARHLETLITLGQSLVTTLDPHQLCETVAHEARHVTESRACAVYLYEPKRDVLISAAFAGIEGTSPLQTEQPLSACLSSTCVKACRQIEFNNIQMPDFTDLVDLPGDPSLHAVLLTPLIVDEETLGVLAIFSDETKRFDNDQKRLCTALASFAAVSLQNARLYSRVFQSEDTLRKNEQLTTLGLLAAEIAHEIRNPLTVLKLLHGQLNPDFPEGDPRRTDMRVISEKLDQLEAIVTRVLNFAKAPSSLHAHWPLKDIIDDTLVLIRLKMAQSKITLHFTPPAEPFIIEAHKGQIQQVLLNLLFNATHAMPQGGDITVNLSSSSTPYERRVHADVIDTGGGIPEPFREKIFDSFLSGRPDGTGLGLAIAKRILISHHGDIALLSTGPAGTTMRITLPLVRI